MTRILVDADACPVKDETVAVASEFGARVVLIANFHHQMPDAPGVEAIVVDDAPDEADLRIANTAGPGDVVVTNDYPLAALVLGKGARAVSPRGLLFTEDNIGPLLEERHRALARLRRGKRPKGPKPLRPADRARFLCALRALLQPAPQDSNKAASP